MKPGTLANTSHAQLEQCLRDAGAEYSAAAAHGLICGIVTMGGARHNGLWQVPVLGEGNTLSTAAQHCTEMLDSLQDDILTDLHDDTLRFTPLLPDDSVPLTMRTRALAEWCEGYLYGLAMGGMCKDGMLPEVVREVMQDFYEISHAGFHLDAPDEGDEVAYEEIAEYVRMSVLLVHGELQPLQTSVRLQ